MQVCFLFRKLPIVNGEVLQMGESGIFFCQIQVNELNNKAK